MEHDYSTSIDRHTLSKTQLNRCLQAQPPVIYRARMKCRPWHTKCYADDPEEVSRWRKTWPQLQCQLPRLLLLSHIVVQSLPLLCDQLCRPGNSITQNRDGVREHCDSLRLTTEFTDSETVRLTRSANCQGTEVAS